MIVVLFEKGDLAKILGFCKGGFIMSKKRCRKCYELNSGNEIICINCNSTLADAEIVEEQPLNSLPKGPIGANYQNSATMGGTHDPYAISLGMWLGIIVLSAIPLINIITICYLAFGNHTDTLKNYGKAVLISSIVAGVLLFMIGFR